MVRIVFEFIGGPKDGGVLRGMLGEPSEAERHYLFSNRGSIGQRFKVASRYAVEMLANEELKSDQPHHFQQHFYIVRDRVDRGDEIRVRAEYAP